MTLQFAASQAMTLLACAAEEQQEGGGALVQGVGPRPEALPHHTRPHTLRSAHLERLHHLLPQARRIKLLAVLLEIGGGAGQLLLRVCVCVCVWRRIAKARMHACTHACMHIAHPLPASFSVSAPPCAPPPPRGWAPVPLRARWRQSPAARAAAPPGRGACCGCTCRPVVREEGGAGGGARVSRAARRDAEPPSPPSPLCSSLRPPHTHKHTHKHTQTRKPPARAPGCGWGSAAARCRTCAGRGSAQTLDPGRPCSSQSRPQCRSWGGGGGCGRSAGESGWGGV